VTGIMSTQPRALQPRVQESLRNTLALSCAAPSVLYSTGTVPPIWYCNVPVQ
jgi:hypothetical protein